MNAKKYNPYTQPPSLIASQRPPQHWVYVAVLGSVLFAWFTLTLAFSHFLRFRSVDTSIAIFDFDVSPSPSLSPSAEVTSSHYFWIEVSLPGLLLVVLASLVVTYLITWAIVARWQNWTHSRVLRDGKT